MTWTPGSAGRTGGTMSPSDTADRNADDTGNAAATDAAIARAATATWSEDTDRPVRRFDRVPRWVHWSTATLMGVCLATAAVLYLGPLSILVGRRHLVETVHLYAGLALPAPMLL